MRDLPLPTLAIADLSAHAAPRRSLRPRGSEAHSPAPAAAGGLEVVWARDEEDVRQAQQLRYLVFADEMGPLILPSIRSFVLAERNFLSITVEVAPESITSLSSDSLKKADNKN